MIAGMTKQNLSREAQATRSDIAARAARMIAQDGAAPDSARRKAARQVLGLDQPPSALLPDAGDINDALRAWLALFGGPEHEQRQQHLRAQALELMQTLAQFQPTLSGAIVQGTAGEHDPIELQLFCDSAKEVQIHLLNRNVKLEVSETPHFKGPRHGPVETVSFDWHGHTVHAQCYLFDDVRGALRPRAAGRQARLDLNGLRALIDSATDRATPPGEL